MFLVCCRLLKASTSSSSAHAPQHSRSLFSCLFTWNSLLLLVSSPPPFFFIFSMATEASSFNNNVVLRRAPAVITWGWNRKSIGRPSRAGERKSADNVALPAGQSDSTCTCIAAAHATMDIIIRMTDDVTMKIIGHGSLSHALFLLLPFLSVRPSISDK